MMVRLFVLLVLSMGFPLWSAAQNPQVSAITSNTDVIDNALVGSGTFSITVTYAQEMNTAVNPVLLFPEAGKDMIAVGALVPATAVWTDAFTFTQSYDVIDLNQSIGLVDVQVSGGVDGAGQAPDVRTETDLFCLTTNVDVPKIINIQYDHKYHVIYIEFDISTNFGGLFGTWAHSDSTLYLQFPELGDLSAYFDFSYLWITRYILKVSVTPKQAADFRNVHTYFEWPIARRDNSNACRIKHYWNGNGFDLDHKAPYITSLTTNLTTITDAHAGTGTFTITATYNENAGGNPQFSFPTLNEDPSNTLTLIDVVKSEGNTKVTATYSVANVSEFIPDIDVKVAGAINEPQYNSLYEPQTDTIFPNVFSINTCAASTAPEIVRSPDLAVICPGEALSVVLTVPGSGGSGICTDEYRFSIDNGTTWSEWSTQIPVFTATPGTNQVQSRRSCSGNCWSAVNTQSWTVSDVTAPTVICKNAGLTLDESGNGSITLSDVFQSGIDNCGTVNQVSVAPNTFACNNIGSNTVQLTVNDGNGNTATCTAIVTVTEITGPGPDIPQVSGITASTDVIDNSVVGSATFSITVTYAQAMNTVIDPVISFPAAGKDMIATGALVPALGIWTDPFTFTQYYDVIDLNQSIGRVSAQVCGATDAAGNRQVVRTETDLFCLSTNVDVPKISSIKYYHSYHVIYIEFDQSTDFGGLSGTWAHSDSILYLQFPELGDLSAYFDFSYIWITRYILKVAVTPKQLAEYRNIHAYFEWPIGRKDNTNACRIKHYWNGDGFNLDHKAPYVTSLTSNLTTITDANTGTGTFTITAQYNENVGGTVQFSFPTLNEDPSNTLTLLSVVKSEGDKKVTATYNVANVNEFVPDIDVQVSGATNEPDYNSLHELQADTIFPNVFSINTCTPSTAPAITRSPDADGLCPGEVLTVVPVAPGSGGNGTCTDQYRYSKDNGATWTSWSTTLPVFSAASGTNMVQSRRFCSGNCSSEVNTVYWSVLDTTQPVVVCKNITLVMDATCTVSIVPADVFQALTNTCSIIDQMSVSPNTFGCNDLCGNTVTLTVQDQYGNTGTCNAVVTINHAVASVISGIRVYADVDATLVGSGTFSITAVFAQAMNTSSMPVFSFPTHGEDPEAIGMLVPATGVWTDAFTFTQYYDVVDLDQAMRRIDVQVCGGVDLAGNVAAARLETDLFCANLTDIPEPSIVDIKYDHLGHVAVLRWDIATDYGDLSGLTWTQSDSLLYFQFPGIGDISPYFDLEYTWQSRNRLVISFTPKQELPDFRDVSLYFVWPIGRRDDSGICSMHHNWSGFNFNVDYKAPYVTSLTTNLNVITQADTGTGIFEITAQYNEDFDGNVVFSFPTLNEDPTTTLTLLSQVKTNDHRVIATYNVATTAAFMPDIDVQVAGAINNPLYASLSEPQADTIFRDVFSINICGASTAPAIVRSPDLESICPGTTLTVVPDIAGSGGAGICTDEYRYSTDNGVTWSAWSSSIPVFAAVAGTNSVMTRRACSGDCNSSEHSVNWEVADVSKPVLVCPADQTIAASANCSGLVGSWNLISKSDNCASPASITETQSPAANTTLSGHNAMQTVTLTASDGNGNSETCFFTVMLKDVTKPVITCPADQTVAASANCSGTVGAWSLVSKSDNCASFASMTEYQSPEATTLLSGHNAVETVTLTAFDGNGNIESCSFTVLLKDVDKPVITCPADQTVAASANCSGLVGVWSLVSKSDNCAGPASITESQSPAANTTLSGHNATQTMTLTASDGNGNTESCSFLVMLKDVTKPVITCPADQTINASANCSGLVGAWSLVSKSDNCASPASITESQSPAANTTLSGQNATQTVTLTAFDGNGNTESCSFLVTLKDVTKPVIACPADQTINASANCSGLVGAWSLVSKSDNCANSASITVSQSPAANTALSGHNATQTVTLTAFDGNGNTESCSFLVTLKDVTKPVIVCPADQTVAASANCSSAVGAWSLVSKSDNCTNSASITVSQSPAANTTLSGHNAVQTVTLTAFDGNGNTESCSFIVTLKDITAPLITCPANQTVAANANASGIVGSWNLISKSDNCTASGLIAEDQSPAASTVLTGHNDVKIIVLTATDAVGNTASCSFTVTLNDLIPPTITCPVNIAKMTDANQCSAMTVYNVIATDNSPGVTTSRTSGLSSGAAFPTGINTVVWKATDVAGLTATCSFTVTVNDGQTPSIVCPANISKTTDVNQCTAVVTYANPTFSDNCAGVTILRTSGQASGTTFSKGVNMVNWKATDAVGNSSVCGFTVTITDGQAPTITCPANQTKNTDVNLCTAVVTYTNPVFSDNCTGVLAALYSGLASGSNFPKGVSTVIWKATDGGGMTATCSFTVTVTDNQAPTITCPANQTKNTDTDLCTAAVTYTTPTFTDNCTGGSVAMQSGLASGSAFPKGINTLVWKATDGAGLTKTCSFKITVNDTQAPAIVCPSNQSKTTDSNLCTAVVTYTMATFTDNCPGGSVVKLSGPASGTSFPKGLNNVVFKATDAAGNQSLCSMTVTVTDAQLPMITCPANLVVTGTISGGVCSAMATYNTPTASDNCGLQSSYLWSGLASGSVFPQGSTTNIWKATDDSGLTATCAFIVTVNCGTRPGSTSFTPSGTEAFTPLTERNTFIGVNDVLPALVLTPNPATTQVQLRVEGLDERGGTLTVFDVQGRVVWQQTLSGAAPSVIQPLQVADFQEGLYQVRLQTASGIVTKGLVIMK